MQSTQTTQRLLDNGYQRLPIVDGELDMLPQLTLEHPVDAIMQQLIDETPWRSQPITLYGKTMLQPRLVAWYGEAAYSYSGITHLPLALTEMLSRLRACVEATTGCAFNSVLLNYYRDQRDSMGLHSDDEPALGEAPTIATLSLGGPRDMIFKHRTKKELGVIKLPLPSGSLLLMRGVFQHYWKHGIRKATSRCNPRLSLTFRTMLPTRPEVL